MGLIWLLVLAAVLAGMWKVFEKAGRQGWEAIVPIYNLYVLTLIVGQPWWLVILSLIPIVGILVMAFLAFKLAERFGQGIPFAIGMIFLPFVFYPLLGFGDAQYSPPAAAE
ncbi:MAG TPA: DUF5684 domain-containing protein [Novimethylophilus sp.]|uniref:DUF5684 domain-containing protein n=1 Tax=Novimethylophilus sp. TaxID=2137426 RepID=UPI002F416939